MRKIDVTGERFGKLTVVEDLGGGKVRCRCDCGKVKVFNKWNVTHGRSTSCGCSRKHKRPELIKSTVGHRFGRLVVKDELGYGKVLCQCDCGNEKVVNKGHLLRGDILSCGCLLREGPQKAKENYMFEGTNIARLTSEKPTSRSKSGVRGVSWHKGKQKWRASICVQGKTHELGMFVNIQDAIKARKATEEKYVQPIVDEWKNKKPVEK